MGRRSVRQTEEEEEEEARCGGGRGSEERGPGGSERCCRLTHPFIDFPMLQLHKASADSSNVALLIREGDPPRSLGVLQLRVCVDAGVANAPVQTVHDHGQLHCRRGRRAQMGVTKKVRENFMHKSKTAQDTNACGRGRVVMILSRIHRVKSPQKAIGKERLEGDWTNLLSITLKLINQLCAVSQEAKS